MSATRRRPSRAVPATITAVVLLAIAVAAGWLAIARLVQGAWPSGVDSAAGLIASASWGSPWVWAVGIVLGVLGLVLLLTAIVPGRLNAVRLGSAPDLSVVMPNSSLAKLATGEASLIDGVNGVRASAGPRRVDLTVTTPLRETAQLVEEVREAVTRRFEDVGTQPRPKVVVHTRTKEFS